MRQHFSPAARGESVISKKERFLNIVSFHYFLPSPWRPPGAAPIVRRPYAPHIVHRPTVGLPSFCAIGVSVRSCWCWTRLYLCLAKLYLRVRQAVICPSGSTLMHFHLDAQYKNPVKIERATRRSGLRTGPSSPCGCVTVEPIGPQPAVLQKTDLKDVRHKALYLSVGIQQNYVW